MEHIKFKTENKNDLSEFQILDFKPMHEYWVGACHIIPDVVRLMSKTTYNGTKTLSWYEKQVLNHDTIMNEFKRILGWQKR